MNLHLAPLSYILQQLYKMLNTILESLWTTWYKIHPCAYSTWSFCFIAHRGHEWSNFQAYILLRPCMSDLWGDIHIYSQTAVFRQQKQQERESSMHIKSYMSLPLMELMDDCCFDGWSCLFWVSMSWLRPSLSLFLSQSMCLDWNLTGSLFKGGCIFSFWSSNYLLLKHISQTFSGMCYVLHQSCLHSFTNTEKGKLLHVNKWIPLVFRAALVLYLDY